MMKRFLLGAAFLTLGALPAHADEKDDRIRALEAQLQFLAAEIETLKTERAAEKAEMAQIKSTAEKAVEMVSAIEPSAGADGEDEVKISLSPSPKFVYGDFSFQPLGRIHLDYAWFNDDVRDHPNGAEFRRARLGAKGQVAADIGYKFEIDFANEGVSFKDVYINYTGIEDTEFRVGSTKPPFGLEELTSSNYTTFIERSAPTSAFATGEIIGAAGYTGGDKWSFAAGAFNDDPGTQSNNDEAWYLAARATAAPVADENATLHLGASAGLRKPDQANESFDFDSRAENAVQAVDSVSANFANAEDAALYGFEAAFVYGPVSAQGEYFIVDVDRDGANSDLDFGGGYAQLAWTLTGERRPYEAQTGKFGRLVPQSPFDPAQGKWGAWEAAARYSTLDVSDENVLGGEMENYTVGLNWYLHKHVRMMMNYIWSDTDANAVTPDDDPQLLLLRGQVDF